MIKGAELQDKRAMVQEDPLAGAFLGQYCTRTKGKKGRGIIKKVTVFIKFRNFVKD
jgi:hypothetical protein